MIEPDVELPAFAVMAAAAGLAQLAGMGIILGVARAAFHRQRDFVGRAHVAAFALCQRVFSPQRKSVMVLWLKLVVFQPVAL